MFCLGYTSALGYKNSGDIIPPFTKEITSAKLQNGIFDHLYITNKVDEATSQISPDWDYDTVLIAEFKNDLRAGNVEYTVDQISQLLIRRRRIDGYQWVTLFARDVNTRDDASFIFVDKTVRSHQEYEYAIVPVFNNSGTDVTYNTNTITAEFDGLFIIGEDKTFNTVLDTKISNIKKNKPKNVINTLGRRYPYIVSNGLTDYTSGTCSGLFIKYIESACDWDKENGWKYREELLDFLVDGKEKLIKYHDGRMWLANISSEPQETENGHEQWVNTSFDFVESGNPESNNDLYNAGIINYEES